MRLMLVVVEVVPIDNNLITKGMANIFDLCLFTHQLWSMAVAYEMVVTFPIFACLSHLFTTVI